MIYKDKSYSKIKLIVSFRSYWYRVETFVTNGRDSLIDMFPSTNIANMLDFVYDETTERFLKFRWDENFENDVRTFIKSQINPKKISLMYLRFLLEKHYHTELKVYNREKWETFTTPV